MVHPLHGAGIIRAVCSRCCDGIRKQYYVLELIPNQGKIYIPIGRDTEIGLRPISSLETAERILYQPIRDLPPQPSTWSCRYRENLNRIRSGHLEEVAQVVFCLKLRNHRRALAGSEKRMLECAEKLLQSELMLITGMRQDEIRQQLEHQWKQLRR